MEGYSAVRESANAVCSLVNAYPVLCAAYLICQLASWQITFGVEDGTFVEQPTATRSRRETHDTLIRQISSLVMFASNLVL